jgi:flagellar basal-body rod modification protein FlgD
VICRGGLAKAKAQSWRTNRAGFAHCQITPSDFYIADQVAVERISMSAITSTLGGAAAGTSSSNQTAATGVGSLTANDFIKFMVTQLQNQDPTAPTDSNAMLSQLTSIGQLQSATDMDTALKGMVQQSSIGSAAAMIGKPVQGRDSTNATLSGTVTSVQVTTNGVNLQLDNGSTLSLANLTSIGVVASNSTTAASGG